MPVRGLFARHAPLEGRRHERVLHASAHAKLVGHPELRRQRHARDAAVDFGRRGQLAELDDRRVDAVQSRGVLVERAASLLERDATCRLQDSSFKS